MRKNRGKFLTIAIILNFGVYLLVGIGAIIALTNPNSGVTLKLSSASLTLDLILGVLGIVSFFGLWQLKKWGAYLFGLAFIYSIVTEILKYPQATTRPTLNLALIVAVLAAVAIYRKWKAFG